jgi:hypothetical protein
MSGIPVSRRLARTLLVIALSAILGGAAAMEAVPAAASSSACGGSCLGKDPNTHGCIGNTDFSDTIDGYAGPQTFTIQLRSSANCGAWWARGVRDDCAYPVYTYIRVQQQVASPYGWYDVHNQYKQMTSTCNGGTSWTNMVDAYSSGYRERACVLQSASGPVDPSTVSDSDWYCTSWQE